jgi:hypothetical protein
MSNTLANTTSLLAKAAVEITWQQWGALGAQTNDIRPAHQAVLDPEALLLVSLALLEHERRLADVIASWVSVNSSLLSVQRVKNLSRTFPIPVQQLLHAVAATAIQDGKDMRWTSLAAPSTEPLAARHGKIRAIRPEFLTTATLMLQLRQGMGVGVKSDLFAFLLTSNANGRNWASTAAMVRALGYTNAAMRRNADDLAAARFIRRMETVDADSSAARLYMAEPANWASALHLGILQPGWRYWLERFAFIADMLDSTHTLTKTQASDFATGVACRTLIEKHRTALTRDTGVKPGLFDDSTDWSAALHSASEQLVEWMRNNP